MPASRHRGENIYAIGILPSHSWTCFSACSWVMLYRISSRSISLALDPRIWATSWGFNSIQRLRILSHVSPQLCLAESQSISRTQSLTNSYIINAQECLSFAQQERSNSFRILGNTLNADRMEWTVQSCPDRSGTTLSGLSAPLTISCSLLPRHRG